MSRSNNRTMTRILAKARNVPPTATDVRNSFEIRNAVDKVLEATPWDPQCWLFDKEERMRKAAAYFARQRIADTTVKEPIEDCI